jgi:magnesium transporter
MIEIYRKDGNFEKLKSVDEITAGKRDFLIIQFLDYQKEELEWAKKNFELDFSIMSHIEDIEISSHFHENAHQSAFHFSLPYYSKTNSMVEESFFLIAAEDRVFTFSSSGLDEFLGETYAFKFQARKNNVQDVADVVRFQIALIADYYADVTENIARRVKSVAARLLIKKEFKEDDLDTITHLNFNNMLIKESMNEFTKILTLFKKSVRGPRLNIRDKIDEELSDLAVVSDYIQFNFDRLDDLKENVSNKIDLEQNRIFKILTMVTVCIALPSLIAAIFSMRFNVVPGLSWMYNYPSALFVMALSAIIPILYFKKKKWF